MQLSYKREFVACVPFCVVTTLSALLVVGTARNLQGQLYTLIDGNSRLEINTSAQATGYDWVVDGVHHMHELSNWYRVGSTGPERSVHTLTVLPGIVSDRDNDSSIDTVTVPYSDSQGRFALEIDYSIFGGAPGSGTSAFDEEIRITNLQSTPLAFHFFEYVDLDLYETPDDDTILLTSQTSLQQFDARTVGNWGFNADRYELNTFPNTVTKLNDAVASNLSGVWPGGTGPIGPGNVTWALQWDFVGTLAPRPAIPPGETVVIKKEGLLQQFVPEPTGVVLAILGGLAALSLFRRQRTKNLWTSMSRVGVVAVVVFVATSSANADDLSPPNWVRRTPPTTVQEWEFLTNVPPGVPASPDGTTAGLSPFYNGGGLALATVGSGLTWLPQHIVNFPGGPVVMQGVYLGDGSPNSFIDFDIPNWVDFEPVKHFRL